jgi:SAM-dependent methyltransferase
MTDKNISTSTQTDERVADKTGREIEIDSRIIDKILDADHLMLSGASSSGKSTFWGTLEKLRLKQFESHKPIIPANWIAEGMKELPAKTMFHINMYRPIFERMKKHPTYVYSNANAAIAYSEYASEPVINQFCRTAKGKITAIIILASPTELIARIKERQVVEPNLEEDKKTYDQNTWMWVAKLHDVEATFKTWLQFLQDKDIETIFVESQDGKFVLLDNVDAAIAHIKKQKSELHESDVKQIWANEPFEYQRVSELVEVNASNFVQGDRAQTAKVIFSSDVKGGSVLDIGCAGGYFCFEAEKAGATRVLGVELKDTRYRQSLLTKRLTNSSVNFVQTSLYDLDTTEKFDVVLFLNVIHHLNEPMRALELLSSITSKRLYLEFPTLTDHKFLSTISLGFWSKLINNFPLIGVSLEAEAGQTFVFTKSAIERILVKNLKAFSKVEFVESHIPNRLLAICHK